MTSKKSKGYETGSLFQLEGLTEGMIWHFEINLAFNIDAIIQTCKAGMLFSERRYAIKLPAPEQRGLIFGMIGNQAA